MVFEAHGMSFPCTELLLFNYAKVNTVFHSMAPLMILEYVASMDDIFKVWEKLAIEETVKNSNVRHF